MKTTVLVVDDDESVRNAVALFLKAKGFGVLKASGGDEAFDLVRSNEQISVVISDIQMPKGDGLSLLKRLRQEVPSAPPVILMSGHSETTAQEVIALGAAAYLPKPFDPKDLVGCVEVCVVQLSRAS